MANNKSEQHIINLANPDLNRERLKGEIMPWDGFNDRNSPYLSGECLPLYTKTITGTDQWVSPSLDVYKFQNRRLTKNGTNVGPVMNRVVKNVIKPSTGDYYIFGGTSEVFFAAEYGQDELKCFIDGSVRFTITYGSGFDWEKAKNWFGANYKRINNTYYIGVCWAGECWAYESDDGSSWTYSHNTLSASGSVDTYRNVTVHISNQAIYFSCLGQVSLKRHKHATGSAGWQTKSTLVAKLSFAGGTPQTATVNANKVYMDNTGNFVTPHYWTIDGDQRTASLYTLDETDGAWDLYASELNPKQVRLDVNQTTTSTNDQIKASRYGTFVRGFTVTETDATAALQWSFIYSTVPNYTTGTALYSGNIENGAQRTIGNFRILFQSGILSSISTTEDEYYRGTLLTPWDTVEDCFVFGNSIGYKSGVDNTWYNLSIYQQNPTYTVYRDRYIIAHTNSYYNTYDIETGHWLHFADDWNNRFTGQNPNEENWYLFASGIESEYYKTFYPFPGRQSNVVWVKRYQGDEEVSKIPNLDAARAPVPDPSITVDPIYLNCFSSAPVDLVTDDVRLDTNVVYRVSVYLNYVELMYQGLYWTYEDNPLINPSLFATFQTDLYTMMTDGKSIALALQQFGKEYLVYYQLSADISFTHLCCVQSLFYGLTDDGIYSVDLSNGILSNSRKIANITGLQYIAYNPLGIVFWNPRNRTMYIFTGDAILKPVESQSSFTSITQSKFRPDTEETFMLTNNGLYVSAGKYCYNIKGNYTDVFFTNFGFALKESNKFTCYAYYPAEGHTTLVPMILETMLYGAGNNIVSTTDCIYLRFYRGDIGNTTANVKISGHTLTDFSTELQDENGKTYTITKDDWDTKTNTYYLRYQPTYQKGLGLSIRIESDVPLIYMGFGSKPETLQITK